MARLVVGERDGDTVMETLLSLLIGILMGTVFAVLNHLILLSGMKRLKVEEEKSATSMVTRVYLIRYIINLVVLFALFFLRKYLPFNWEYSLIGAAVGLTVPARIMSVKWGLEKKPKPGADDNA